MTSRNIGGVMVSTLGWNVRDVVSIAALGAIFSILIIPMTRVYKSMGDTCRIKEDKHINIYIHGGESAHEEFKCKNQQKRIAPS